EMARLHLLLAFFYAMQPGVFSFSMADLLGMTEPVGVDPMAPNEKSLYGSLPSQMKNSCSFANELKKILSVRTDSGIENGELIAIPDTHQRGLILLLHRLKGSRMLQLTAVNFSQMSVQETLDLPSIRQTTAI